MTESAELWSRDAAADSPGVHALVIGVSAYDHLAGGTGPTSESPMLAGIGQLGAAATSAVRFAEWLRDHYDYPLVPLARVLLLASPSPDELPLPGGVDPAPATTEEVKKAIRLWRDGARAVEGNITVLYVAGHGIQLSNEGGGILLLQDAGSPDHAEPLEGAIDVSRIRKGMVSDPTIPGTSTPPVQYYFYDACRIEPGAVRDYSELQAGVFLNEPRGTAADMSWMFWGSRPKDFALADADAKTTLFSRALLETMDSKAPADAADGRTVRFSAFAQTLEEVLRALAEEHGEEQRVIGGGIVSAYSTPVCLRAVGPSAEPTTGVHDQKIDALLNDPEVLEKYSNYVAAGNGAGSGALGGRVGPIKRLTRWLALKPLNVTGDRGKPGFPPGDITRFPRPVEVPPPAVAVTVRCSDDEVRAFTLLLGGAVAAAGSTGTPVAVGPGDYTIVVDLPWGGVARRPLTVPAWSSAFEQRIDVDGQRSRSPLGPRMVDQLGAPAGSAVGWCVRFLTSTAEGLRFLPDQVTPALEVDDVDDFGAVIVVHANNEVPQLAQVLTDDGRSLVVALPVRAGASDANACLLHVRVTETSLGVAVRFLDDAIDTAAGYLLGGRPDHVIDILAAAGPLADGDVTDPFAAAIAGYALLRLNELSRLEGWIQALVDVAWLPDGPAIAAELASRAGDEARAAELAVEAMRRGVPVFTAGLSIVGEHVRSAIRDATRDDRRVVFGEIASTYVHAASADFATLATTLRIDPDPGPITADRGWRRFVHARTAEDPRAFWRSP